jgi:hypothetical protein
MNRLEKIQYAINKGITCDINTGIIYGINGDKITRRDRGYINIGIKDDDNKGFNILGHQFIYYIAYGKIEKIIDHINGDKSDNRIVNLRGGDHSLNQQNRSTLYVKGYTIRKNCKNKYQAKITINYKSIVIGNYATPEEAREAYLNAKKIYHKW